MSLGVFSMSRQLAGHASATAHSRAAGLAGISSFAFQGTNAHVLISPAEWNEEIKQADATMPAWRKQYVNVLPPAHTQVCAGNAAPATSHLHGSPYHARSSDSSPHPPLSVAFLRHGVWRRCWPARVLRHAAGLTYHPCFLLRPSGFGQDCLPRCVTYASLSLNDTCMPWSCKSKKIAPLPCRYLQALAT